MKILFLGAGGVGGYFGARLFQAGASVGFLVRERRASQIASKGLVVESPHGNFTISAQAHTLQTTGVDALKGADLIALSPKAYDLEDAIDSIRPALDGRAFILPLLNGVAHMERLDSVFGADRVLGGVAHVAAALSSDGVIRQLNPLHSLTIGPRSPGQEEAARAFHGLCEKAHFDAIYSNDIEQSLWDKWTFLATLAGSTTLGRSGVGAITASGEGSALMKRMYQECLDVAKAFGKPVGEPAQAKALGILMQPGSDFTASMLRDLLAGQRTEHEHILGEMVRRAQAKGIDAPMMTASYVHMLAETGSNV